jgi:hypothetical protein
MILLRVARIGGQVRSAVALASLGGKVEEIKRLDALLEYAVMHGDEAEAERLRAALRKLTDKV